MSAYPNSAARQAAAIRAHARRGVWRPLLSALGVTVHTRAADAQARAWGVGGEGEAATAALLKPLRAQGWLIRHDLQAPWGQQNYDHVLVSPCGTVVVVLDSKKWRRNWPTRLVRGRVYCGPEDRHEQVLIAAKHARQVEELLEAWGVSVLPLLVVHGSPVAGGHLDVRVKGLDEPVFVLDPAWLVSTLAECGRKMPANPRRAAALIDRVDQVLKPYAEGERR